MPLDMYGHIDDTFRSVTDLQRTTTVPGTYVGGVYVPGTSTTVTHRSVNVQPLNDREINSLQIGAERISDVRKAYINDGLTTNLTPADSFVMFGQTWKLTAVDNRPWNNYCKCILTRNDNQ